MKLSHKLAGLTAAAALCSAMIFSVAPAHAQTYDPKYPVCLQVYQSMVDFYFDCSYTSMPQCQMTASGRSAQCVINPYYAGPKGKRSKKRPQ
ncbi:MAG: DUF3551 domain-containing protein [Bradyrhizobium sp.]|uniref:DUF3551 domain-containing protein n=1 Tax=Bradyrhizobium sp. TaxID=376 RepID=UPI002A324C3C|nr:DUF3551 domain-containing protein [Bradyrhizobium sp.]